MKKLKEYILKYDKVPFKFKIGKSEYRLYMRYKLDGNYLFFLCDGVENIIEYAEGNTVEKAIEILKRKILNYKMV